MKKLSLIFLLMLIGYGCEQPSSQKDNDITNDFILPKELEGCKIFRLVNNRRVNNVDGPYLYVIIKKDEIISVSKTGKTPRRVMIIDGNKYQKIEE